MFIDSLRQRSQSKILRVIMALIASSFALFGLQNYLISSGKQTVAARVGDIEISERLLGQETDKNINRWVQQTHKKPTKAITTQMRQMTLVHLVQKFAQIQAAKNMGFYADNALVSDILVKDDTFAKDGRFDKAYYQTSLQRWGVSEKQLFAAMSDSLLLNQLQTSILTSAFVLPVELTRFKALQNETRDVAVLILPTSLARNVKIDNLAVENYYRDHSSDFMTQDKVKLSYLLIDRKLQGSEEAFLSLSDQLADLSYGEGNALDETAKQLGLALHHSPWLGRDGSKHGLFADKGLMQAAFSAGVLHEGENSGLIPVGEKAVVLRVSYYQEASLKPLRDVKADITKKLTLKAQRDVLLDRAHAMVEDINLLSDKNALQKFVRNHRLPIKVFKHITRKPSKNVPMAIQQLAFQQLQPQKSHLSSAVLSDDLVQLVVLLACHPGKNDEKTSSKLSSHLQNLQSQSELRSLQQSILAGTKISAS